MFAYVGPRGKASNLGSRLIFYYLFLNFLQCDKVFHANILVQRGLKADMVGKHWYRGISFKLRVFRNQLKIPCFTFE